MNKMINPFINKKQIIPTLFFSLMILGLQVTGYTEITPVSERTSEVADAIVAAAGVESAGDVTGEQLAAITTLNLRSKNITSLLSGDFSGMTGLTSLNLYGNELSSLPDGIFEGLTKLTTLRLGGNTVDPIPITVSLEKVGSNQVKAVVPAGAPFEIDFVISVTNGTIVEDETTLTVKTGGTASEAITINRTEGTTAAVTTGIETISDLPSQNHYGYSLTQSSDLPITVISAVSTETANTESETDAPVFSDGESTTRSVPENTAAAQNIGSAVSATQSDGASISYSLSGTDAASFDIVSTSGQLQTKAGLDYETKNSYTVTITATDSNSRTDTISVTINVTDVNEAPVFSSVSTTLSVAENTAAGTNIGAAITATDDDSDTLSYSLTGTDAASFAIVGSSGQLQTKAALNYEAKNVYYVSIIVSDGSLNGSIAVTINITDVDEPNLYAPAFTDGDSTTRSIQENTAAGVNIGNAVSATDDDGDTLTYSLSGTDAASFDIVGTSGQLQTKAALDHETKSSYTVTITATDIGDLTDTISVTINVSDVNEAPVFASDSITLSIAENTAAGMNIGSAVTATDVDDDTLTYSLGGTDPTSFDIDSSSGQIKTKAALDYDTKSSYSVTVTAQDTGDLSDTIAVTINVTVLNLAPVFSSDSLTLSVAENTDAGVNIGSAISATDDNDDTLTYSLGGTDAESFDIVETSGQLQTKSALNYESKFVYDLSIIASDGSLTDSIAITIYITNVHEEGVNNAPVFSEGFSTMRSVPENTAAGVNIGSAVTATDGDGDTVRYTLGGPDNSLFDLDSMTGQLKTKGALDYETKSSYSVTMHAKDSTDAFVSIKVTINVTDGNDAPFYVSDSISVSVAENTVAGTDFDSAITATDVDGDTLSYTLSGPDSTSFDIVRESGQLQTNAALDYESKHVYYVTVTASDGSLTDSVSVTIKVTDVHEQNINNRPIFAEGVSTTRSVTENTAAGVNIGPAVSATDSDGDSLSYTISGTDAPSFDFDTSTGQLTTKAALDFETTSSYLFDITVSDGNGGSVSISVTIKVVDVMESKPMSERTKSVSDAIVAALTGVSSASEVTDLHLGSINTLRIATISETTLKNGDFNGLSSLTELGIQFNRSLRSVPKDLFEGLYSLKTLHLSSNGSLSSLPEGLFDGLSSLETLSLLRNALTTLPEDIFDGLSSLTKLDLSLNPISTLPEEVFDGLTNLVTLSLHRCSLPSLLPNLFDGLSNLAYLKLDANRLKSLPAGVFEGLTSLIDVDVHHGATSLYVTVSIEKVQDGQFKATVDTGAPFDMVLPISVTNGSIDGDATTIEVKTGKIRSDTTLSVTRETGTTGSVSVDIGTLPALPESEDHAGYTLVKSNLLPVSVIPATEAAENTAPSFPDGESATRSIAENTASAQNIGSAVGARDPEGDTLTYTLSGADASTFTIDSANGQLKTSGALDYETKTSYSVTITANDPDNLSDSISVTINVTDVNEAPVFASDSITRSVAENTAASVNIGSPITATDEDGDTLSYSLSGTDAASFSIVSTSGQLQTKAKLDYETKTSYSVTVTAKDGDDASDSISVTINITDVEEAAANNAPVFSDGASTTRSIPENTANGVNIGSAVSATDADDDTLTYSLGGADAASFSIDSTDGQLKTKSPLDYETKTAYSVTVTVKDDNEASDSISVTINVTDVTETVTTNAPVFTEGESATRSVAENTETGQNIGNAVSATDADDDTLTYSLSGTDSASFAIVSTNGQLKTKSALDYETKKSYAVVVTASDGSKSDSINITINVTDVNDAPKFAAETTTLSIAENTAADTNIGEAVSATDADDETLTYSLGGTDAASFSIDTTDGQLKTKSALDYETKKSYSVTITVKDDDDASDSISVTINVTDVNDAPTFASKSGTRSVAENTDADTDIGEAISATDADDDTLTYSLGGTDAASFSIDATDGQLKTKAALDYETKKSYSVTITVKDDDDASDSISVTINVTDANDPPVFASESVTRTVTENTAADTDIGEAISATDADDDTLTYSLGGTDAASFSIDATDGQLKTKAALDYETKTSYSVTITATDDDSASDSISVTINVTDVEEVTNSAPVITEGESASRSIAENTAADANIGSTVAATDEDDDTLTYSLSGTNATSFDIDTSDGQLKTKDALNYETKSSYSVMVTVSDGSLTDSITITINVTDANDAPVFASDSATRSIDENTAANTSIGDVITATDEDNDTLTYSLGGTDADDFNIDDSSGQLSTKTVLDYELKSSYSVTITVTDTDNEIDSINVTITVSDVSDVNPPIFDTSGSITLSVVENTPADTNIGNPVTATRLSPITYSLRGTDADSFAIHSSSGQIKTKDDLDYETKNSYAVQVVATNSDGTATKNVTINITDVFESRPLSQRTRQVRAAIIAAIDGVSRARDVTDEHLSSIKKLDLSSKSMSTPHVNDFEGLSSLEELDLNSNPLLNLPADLFDGLGSLKKLYLNSAGLSTLPSDIFDGLSSLNILNLETNSLVSLPSDVFDGLSSLTELHLNANLISSLEVDVFDDLTSLKKLYLNNNQLSSLESTLFQELSSLTHLYLQYNLLSKLPDNIFKGLSKINTINANNNSTSPLEMEVTLSIDASNKITAKILTGAPFAVVVPVTISNRRVENTINLNIAKGSTVSSDHFQVLVTNVNFQGQFTADIGNLPSVPSRHAGLSLEESDDLPLRFTPNLINLGAPNSGARVPDRTALLSNYPNPFNPETWIPYQLSKPSDVRLTIYDVQGTVVRDLALGQKAAGYYTDRQRAAHWDGRNNIGEKVSTGLYFCIFKAGDFTATRKMLIRK